MAAGESGITASKPTSPVGVSVLLALCACAIAIGATVSPTAGVAFAVLVIVTGLAIEAPAYAFVIALLLFGLEGSIKMRLTVEDAPEPLAVGAGLIDASLAISVLGLVAHDRGRSLAHLWERLGRAGRTVTVALAAWVVLAILQVPLGDDLVNALEGLRVVHFYVLALPGGVLLAAQLPARGVERALLAIFLAIAGYAALRGVTGPSDAERAFTESRAHGSVLGEQPRDTGSFTSPVALVSYLVPAASFGLALACLNARLRIAGVLVFGLGMIGVIASYVRTALVATVAGVGALAAVLLTGRRVSPALKLVTATLVALVLAGGYGATLIAGEVDPVTKHRAETLADPFTDYSFKERLKIWDRTLDRAVDEPLGTGMGTVGRATVEGRRVGAYTDNSYLKILQEQGFPGAFLFLSGVLGAVALCWRRLAQAGPLSRPLGVAALVAVVAFLVLASMAEYIEQPGKALFWALLGVATWEAYER